MVVRVEGLDRRDALLGIALSAAAPPLLAPAVALADEATTGTAAPTLSPCDIQFSLLPCSCWCSSCVYMLIASVLVGG